MPRFYHSPKASLCVLLLGTVGFAGCSSTGRTHSGGAVHQFAPVPRATVATENLDPVENRSVTELLHKAEDAYRRANEAQERGNKKEALQYYTEMMELLLDADLDPAIYYDLRKEFGSIIDKSHRQARLSDRQRTARTFTGAGGISIPQPLPQRVLDEIDRIENVYPKNFQYGLNQYALYADYLRGELKKAGLPEDLVWVAMIESHFTPKIVSRAGAGGMWQFMRGTGQRYGLRVDSYVDERYNWQRSTSAAIEYLKLLYTTFDGDWALAVSAYNMGEGGLGRAIEANGGQRDLWALLDTPPASERIQEETKQYYAKFLAALIVGSDPEAYGFTIPASSPENTVRMPVSGMYALSDLNAAMGLAPGTLARLNPELVREVTPPSGAHALAVPAEAQAKLSDAMKVVAQRRETVASHKVRKGDTIAQLAKKYGVSEGELMKTNKIRSARSLRVGQVLKLPNGAQPVNEPEVTTTVVAEDTPRTKEPVKVAGGKGKSTTYRVKAGDTLYDIARAHDVRIEDLREWNGLDKKNAIYAGQNLKVYGSAATDTVQVADAAPAKEKSATKQAPAIHVVAAGEYPAKIAKAYGMELKELLALNQMKADATLRVGDKLKVASNVAADSGAKPAAKSAEKATKASEKDVYHKVAPGDTAYQIAQQYGVPLDKFLEWNGLNPSSVLRPGDTHVVHVDGSRVKHAAGEAETAETESASDGNRETHIVAKGQNPSSIAQRYGVKVSDLYRWNNWTKQHVLRVGDAVVYYK